MKDIKFQSTLLSDVDFVDVHLHFKNGEVKSVPDDVAEKLLKNPNCTDVTAQAKPAQPVIPPSQDEKE